MILRRFHLNPGTGGDGFHKGGDGVVRELLFRKAQVLSVLSERRAFRPYGMNGMVLFLFVCLFVFRKSIDKLFKGSSNRSVDYKANSGYVDSPCLSNCKNP